MSASLTLTPAAALARLHAHCLALHSEAHGRRIAIGIAGGPGTGKSTLAGELVTMLEAAHPGLAALVPMDGFHMRHAKLEALGTAHEKGAPHTFEGAAFVDFLAGLKRATGPVSGPGYSRKIEDVVENAFTIPASVQVLVVEGNYLLLPDAPWAGIKPLLDWAVFIEVARDTVRARLLKRHGEEGLFTEERNLRHVETVDLVNYDRVASSRDRADLILELETDH
ncbi:nucleoside/nucleotide kinase family protein [Arsenicitalea aurantiaca]|uniref:Nucleoside/nucleotide kinase family protein n=1 Tax=Arsenicitalea aurantiaca TaxID=1783274 RepID=A0A433XKC1_9HYPH|nr:nucleoside/nucleotide kinase family protein [Arsenicitalea aurantiaca]RUT34503.1 nucleoside/nucleotide kinase family protein [Arsenicitalea aurantiaca]